MFTSIADMVCSVEGNRQKSPSESQKDTGGSGSVRHGGGPFGGAGRGPGGLRENCAVGGGWALSS